MMRSNMPQQINQGIGTLNERARGMYRGPRGIGSYAQYMQEGGEVSPPRMKVVARGGAGEGALTGSEFNQRINELREQGNFGDKYTVIGNTLYEKAIDPSTGREVAYMIRDTGGPDLEIVYRGDPGGENLASWDAGATPGFTATQGRPGRKPGIGDLMRVGATFEQASELLGSGLGDTRDWRAIMASENPLAAAAAGMQQRYGGLNLVPEYRKGMLRGRIVSSTGENLTEIPFGEAFARRGDTERMLRSYGFSGEQVQNFIDQYSDAVSPETRSILSNYSLPQVEGNFVLSPDYLSTLRTAEEIDRSLGQGPAAQDLTTTGIMSAVPSVQSVALPSILATPTQMSPFSQGAMNVPQFTQPVRFMQAGGEVGRGQGQGSTTGMPQSGPARDVYTGPSGERLNAVRERVIASSGVDPVQIAAEEGVDPNLFLNLIAQESGGRANAESEAGAYGFTQLMDATARELGVDRTDPVQNLRGGARYLRQQIETFQDIPLALAAYNAGPGAVRRFGGIPPYAETRQYVANILGLPGGGQAVSPTMRPSPVVPVPRPAEQDRGFVGMVPQRNPLNELGELLVSRPAPQIAADQAARLTEQLETGHVAPGLAGFTGLMRSMP